MLKTMKTLLCTTLAVSVALAGNSVFASSLPKGTSIGPAGTIANAENSGLYVSVFAGEALGQTVTAQTQGSGSVTQNANSPIDTGHFIGGALGMRLTPSLRGEVEVSYAAHSLGGITHATFLLSGTPTQTHNTTAVGSVSAVYLLGNLWYDLDTGSPFTPYTGGGMGLAKLTTIVHSGMNVASDTPAVAAQLGAGVRYEITDGISVELGYRSKFTWTPPYSGLASDGHLANNTSVEQTAEFGLTFGL
jgi:opacity protein-like surface antigen